MCALPAGCSIKRTPGDASSSPGRQLVAAERSLVPLDDATRRLAGRTQWGAVTVDQFDGPTLDPGRWSHCYPWGSCTNGANDEYQWYLPQNVSVDHGMLDITAQRQASPLVRSDRGARRTRYPYSSGMVTTHGRLEARVGGVDVRAKVPSGQALWPAIWLLPSTGSPPEFDLMEVYGASTQVHQTAHPGSTPKQATVVPGVNPTNAFHTYSARWDDSSVVFMVDGTVTMVSHRSSNTAPLYLLLNLAVGSKSLGAPTAATPRSAQMEVDAVAFMEDER